MKEREEVCLQIGKQRLKERVTISTCKKAGRERENMYAYRAERERER